VLKEVHALEQKAEDILDQASDLEYQLITQGLVHGPSPNQEQMADIENLHKKSHELVHYAT